MRVRKTSKKRNSGTSKSKSTGTRKIAAKKQTKRVSATKKTKLSGVKGGGSKNITKKDLVHDVALLTDMTQKDVKKVVDSLTATIKDSVKSGKNITIATFGSFKKVRTKPRKGMNFKTGKPINIPAKDKLTFTASKA